MKIIVVCDRCNKHSEVLTCEYAEPEGWTDLTYEYGYRQRMRYRLCGECSQKLGIPAARTDIDNQGVGERLLSVLEEIVQAQIQQ